jgi:tRNA(adenine34) deaminase
LLEPGLWNHDPRIHGGILADECGMILKDFFRGLRQASQKPVLSSEDPSQS